MSAFEEGLYDHLSSDAGLVALVGDQIYPVRLAQGADLPALSWFTVDAPHEGTHDPYPTQAWVRPRVSFSGWGETAADAIAVGDAVVAALSEFSGDLGGFTVGAADVVLKADRYEADTKLYRRIVDVRFAYEDTLAGT